MFTYNFISIELFLFRRQMQSFENGHGHPTLLKFQISLYVVVK